MTVLCDRLTDPAAVKSVLSDVWPYITDDFCPDKCPDLVLGTGATYVGVWDDDELVGAYSFRMITGLTWEGHINVRPSAWGKSDEYTHAAIAWMREHTPCERVVGFIPVTCAEVLQHVVRCGFSSHAVIQGGTLLGGERVDLVMVEY